MTTLALGCSLATSLAQDSAAPSPIPYSTEQVISNGDSDADQWVSAMEKAGGKMIVLVCNHHDGLCLWQTRYTSHSVAASPWLDGKGSVVKAVADAARESKRGQSIVLCFFSFFFPATKTAE